jgi:hypothetical protein
MSPNIRQIRHANLAALFHLVEGSVTALADKLDRSEPQVSKLLSNKVGIGGRLARHIELCFGLERGWLDREHPTHDPGELMASMERFLSSGPSIELAQTVGKLLNLLSEHGKQRP